MKNAKMTAALHRRPPVSPNLRWCPPAPSRRSTWSTTRRSSTKGMQANLTAVLHQGEFPALTPSLPPPPQKKKKIKPDKVRTASIERSVALESSTVHLAPVSQHIKLFRLRNFSSRKKYPNATFPMESYAGISSPASVTFPTLAA